MPLVNVMVNGRAFTVACDEGEEDHLKEIAGHVDAKAREVLASVGQVGDSKLVLMAALLLADELHEALGKLGASATQAGTLAGERDVLSGKAEAAESAAADALERAAARVADIAGQLAEA